MHENKNMTDYKMSLRQRILETAMHFFAERGIKGTKMDDVAASLGISKRTLYEVFDTKEQVLYEGVCHYHQLREEQLKAFANDASHDVLDIIIYLYSLHVKESANVKPMFYEEIRSYPRLNQFIENQKRKNSENFLTFIHRGIDEGLFLPHIDYQLIAHVFEAVGQYMNERRLYECYSFNQLFFNMLFVTLRGFCTTQGIVRLDKFFDEHRAELRA